VTQLPASPPPPKPPAPAWRQALFVAVALLVVWPWKLMPSPLSRVAEFITPQAALILGILLALAGLTAFEAQSKKVSRILIQVCVVLLGLRLDLRDMWAELTLGGLLAVATVFGALALGLLLGQLLKTGREVSLLVSSGTAICGGSAIAAVGSSIGATSSAMAVSTAAIFVLNAVGLFVLPMIGHHFGLTDQQFGAWAGISLHDIASVAGAGKAYSGVEGGGAAADTAMIVKLTRVIWITPIALAARWWVMRDAARTGAPTTNAPFPWFILGFLGASAVRTFVPEVKDYSPQVAIVAGHGFQLALFLIGAGLSVKALKTVGWRALVQAAVLWVIVSALSLWAVKATST